MSDQQVADIVAANTHADRQKCRNCHWPGSRIDLCRVCLAILTAIEELKFNDYWLEVTAWEQRMARRRRP